MPCSPFFGSTTRQCPAGVGVCRVMHCGVCLPKSRRELFCVEHGCRLRSGACAAPKLAFPQRSGHKKNTAGIGTYLRCFGAKTPVFARNLRVFQPRPRSSSMRSTAFITAAGGRLTINWRFMKSM